MYLIAPCLLLVWLHGSLGAQASLQNDVVAAAGHTGTVAGITVSATIGEAVTTTIGNNQNVLTQGFHQTQLTIVPIRDVVADNPVRVFPNPAAATCTVSFDRPTEADLRYALFDLHGRTVLQGNLYQGILQHQLDLTTLAPGAYQLVLTTPDANHYPAVFQLIKIAP